jgi:hypothetical protein
MANDERDDRPGQEGFVTDILREATVSGTPDEPPPPEDPQSAALPRGGAGAGPHEEPGEDEGDRD